MELLTSLSGEFCRAEVAFGIYRHLSSSSGRFWR